LEQPVFGGGGVIEASSPPLLLPPISGVPSALGSDAHPMAKSTTDTTAKSREGTATRRILLADFKERTSSEVRFSGCAGEAASARAYDLFRQIRSQAIVANDSLESRDRGKREDPPWRIRAPCSLDFLLQRGRVTVQRPSKMSFTIEA
jgi:hypothetical protein